jgi:hypothetical protein
MPKTLADRFWSKVDRTGDHWLWRGALTSGGYGVFWLGGRLARAHRVALEWSGVPLTDGDQVDHVCHVRACVRPSHLRRVTSKQNKEHRAAANRNSRSGVLGVYPRYQRWVAAVTHERVKHRLGSFATVEEAEAAVIAKRNELFTHNDRDRP